LTIRSRRFVGDAFFYDRPTRDVVAFFEEFYQLKGELKAAIKASKLDDGAEGKVAAAKSLGFDGANDGRCHIVHYSRDLTVRSSCR
jgi:hypothetical protein